MDTRRKITPWRRLHADPVNLRLEPTLLSGGTYRWRRLPETGTYVGVVGDAVVELREDPAGCDFRVRNADAGRDAAAVEAPLRTFLGLHRGVDLRTHWEPLSRYPPRFREAFAAVGQGSRCPHLDRLEAIVCFVGSANNTIVRNTAMVLALCAAFPASELLRDETGAHFAFPTAAQLGTLSEADLRALGWGYRAARVAALPGALEALGGDAFLDAVGALDDAAARAALCQLPGVGPKVADCALLTGWARDSIVPVDTHVRAIAERHLGARTKGKSLSPQVYEEVVACYRRAFGAEYAGCAFGPMFTAELHGFKDRLRSPAPALVETGGAPSPQGKGAGPALFDTPGLRPGPKRVRELRAEARQAAREGHEEHEARGEPAARRRRVSGRLPSACWASRAGDARPSGG